MSTRPAHALGCASLVLLLLAQSAFAAGGFRAAVVKVDITPKERQWLFGYGPRQSTGVHDRLFHRIALLDDGQTQFVLASSDLCGFSPAVYDEAAAELERKTGIGRMQFWWTVTHTHAAPEVGPPAIAKIFSNLSGRFEHDYEPAYTEQVKRSLVAGIEEARGKLAPAKLEAGIGMAMANINRRAPNGKGDVVLGLNPYGPTDRQVGLLRLTRDDGSLLCLVANYAMHATVLSGKNTLISADAPGVVSEYVEEKLGAPLLYINGAAGNLAPIYTGRDTFPASHINEFTVLLGDRILAANRDLPARSQAVKIVAGEKIVETPRGPDLGWPKGLESYSRTADDGRALVRLPVRFAKLSDEIVLWAAPVEMFCEIAIGVRSASPFPFTFYCGYANGWLGYLPSRQAFAEGGYEVKTSPFTLRAEGDLRDAVMARLQAMAP